MKVRLLIFVCFLLSCKAKNSQPNSGAANEINDDSIDLATIITYRRFAFVKKDAADRLNLSTAKIEPVKAKVSDDLLLPNIRQDNSNIFASNAAKTIKTNLNWKINGTVKSGGFEDLVSSLVAEKPWETSQSLSPFTFLLSELGKDDAMTAMKMLNDALPKRLELSVKQTISGRFVISIKDLNIFRKLNIKEIGALEKPLFLEEMISSFKSGESKRNANYEITKLSRDEADIIESRFKSEFKNSVSVSRRLTQDALEDLHFHLKDEPVVRIDDNGFPFVPDSAISNAQTLDKIIRPGNQALFIAQEGAIDWKRLPNEYSVTRLPSDKLDNIPFSHPEIVGVKRKLIDSANQSEIKKTRLQQFTIDEKKGFGIFSLFMKKTKYSMDKNIQITVNISGNPIMLSAEKIGAGGFGNVYRVGISKLNSDEKFFFAVKKINLEEQTEITTTQTMSLYGVGIKYIDDFKDENNRVSAKLQSLAM